MATVSLEALLLDLKIDPRKVAVERNLEIVPRSQYDDITVEEGDSPEKNSPRELPSQDRIILPDIYNLRNFSRTSLSIPCGPHPKSAAIRSIRNRERRPR